MTRTIQVWLIVACGLPWAASSIAGQEVVRDPYGMFASDSVVLLFDGGFFTEGPALGPDGHLYFSDITFTGKSGMQAGHIWRHDLASGVTEIFRSPSGMSNGLAFDHEGRLLSALGADFGGRAVVRTDMQSGRSEIVAGLYAGRRLNSPNDLVLDERGRIYFTDPRYEGHETIDQPVMGVYRIDPDGMAVDIEGNLYLARPNYEPGPYGVYVHSSAGMELAFLSTPESPTNVAFGHGAHGKTLFITAGGSVYSIRTRTAGYNPVSW